MHILALISASSSVLTLVGYHLLVWCVYIVIINTQDYGSRLKRSVGLKVK